VLLRLLVAKQNPSFACPSIGASYGSVRSLRNVEIVQPHGFQKATLRIDVSGIVGCTDCEVTYGEDGFDGPVGVGRSDNGGSVVGPVPDADTLGGIRWVIGGGSDSRCGYTCRLRR